MNLKISRLAAPVGLVVTLLVATAEAGQPQSALEPAGLQAERLEYLWWVFFYICAAVYVIVVTILMIALIRRKMASAESAPELVPEPGRERRILNTIKGAVAVTVIVLFGLMFVSFRTGSAINSFSDNDDPLVIKVTGTQWWWDVEYRFEPPSLNVRTANELRLPAGRPIKLELHSNDVIHSFWLPNLHGKKDLIPNYPTTFFFRAERPGTYWGQCAEFCGYQHARMRFHVTVESPEEFENWLAAQRQTPPPPTEASARRGQEIFLRSVCIQCHAVQGTTAAATVGPNLTHVASRQYLGAGSMQNTREHLRSWISDPQKVKPGIRMPMNTFSDEDLDALVAYLETLK